MKLGNSPRELEAPSVIFTSPRLKGTQPPLQRIYRGLRRTLAKLAGLLLVIKSKVGLMLIWNLIQTLNTVSKKLVNPAKVREICWVLQADLASLVEISKLLVNPLMTFNQALNLVKK